MHWRADTEHPTCPLRETYQLVRNTLAASFNDDGNLIDGYAVLLYDARNPAFQTGGRGHAAYSSVKAALREPQRLQKMSWQSLLEPLRDHRELEWLMEELCLKYGF